MPTFVKTGHTRIVYEEPVIVLFHRTCIYPKYLFRHNRVEYTKIIRFNKSMH